MRAGSNPLHTHRALSRFSLWSGTVVTPRFLLRVYSQYEAYSTTTTMADDTSNKMFVRQRTGDGWASDDIEFSDDDDGNDEDSQLPFPHGITYDARTVRQSFPVKRSHYSDAVLDDADADSQVFRRRVLASVH